MPKEPWVNLFVARATRRIPPALTGCVLTRTAWETHWCSQWGCCKPPEVEMDNSDFEEPPAKWKTMPRFASPLSPSKMDTICQCYVPRNTKKATSWAVRAFEQWRDQRNEKSSKECPSDLLEKPTADSLNRWLPRFVVEA